MISGAFVGSLKTLEVDNKFSKSVDFEGEKHLLNIYDTHGEPTKRQDDVLKSAQGIILLYSIDSMDSFLKAQQLHQHIMEIRNFKTTCFMLVGNKADLQHNRQVTEEQGKSYADKIKAPFVEISCLKYENVERVFRSLILYYRLNEYENVAYENQTEGGICVLL